MNSKDLSFLMGKRLKEQRQKRKLSHIALSEAIKEKYGVSISKDSLINYEIDSEYRGKPFSNNGMKTEYLRCLADYYGISADYLLGLSNVPDRNKDIDTINKELGFTSPAANQLFQLSPAERRFLCDLLEKADCLKDIALSYELLKNHISYEKALEAANECPEADRWRNDLEYIKFTLSRSFLKFVEKD